MDPVISRESTECASCQAAVVGQRFGKTHAMPAPSDAARPTANASQVFRGNAAAKTGASVETEPSISLRGLVAQICKTKSRRFALSSSSRTSGLSSVFSSSAARWT